MAKQSTHIWPQGIHTSILRSEDTQLQKLGKIQSELRKPTKNHVEFQKKKSQFICLAGSYVKRLMPKIFIMARIILQFQNYELSMKFEVVK